ncbi:MAG: sugar transferase [Aeromicrobium sp.]|uniref:sugar transferase n=1 Tax=Aeromicrobium sp. TaxID=1871063 RepID=UPI0039E3CD0E
MASAEPSGELNKFRDEDQKVESSDRRSSLKLRFKLARILFISDALTLSLALLFANLVKFSSKNPNPEINILWFTVGYEALGVAIGSAWLANLQVAGARDYRIIGVGALEYRRIVRASILTFGILSILSLLFKVDMSRGYLLIAFPAGLAGLLVGRKIMRVWLRRERRSGKYVANALLIGGSDSARYVADWLDLHVGAGGVRVTGVWTPDEKKSADQVLEIGDRVIPVLGSDGELSDALEMAHARRVIVTDSEHLGHHGIKELIWELSEEDADLMISPNIFDVSRSRLQLTMLASMPFLHVEDPRYGDASSLGKVLFDRLGALALMVVFAPVLLVAAVSVKLSSSGPIFYKQERVGRDGRKFEMIKFRSMYVDADSRLATLLAESGSAMAPLAKLQDDPRVTPVGAFIRRYSVDELPQLFNVLMGSMSLVGPRPQRQFEVDTYDAKARRRLRVLPGMTGLWQVSGRSDLSWEEALRLDIYYVENWSITGDVLILWKTFRAVFWPEGAY